MDSDVRLGGGWEWIRDAAIGAALGLAIVLFVDDAFAGLPRGANFQLGNAEGPSCDSRPNANPCVIGGVGIFELCNARYAPPVGHPGYRFVGVWLDSGARQYPTSDAVVISGVGGSFGGAATRYGKYLIACANLAVSDTTPMEKDDQVALYVYPSCQAGAVEHPVWLTTIASGSTSLSYIPTGSPPSSMCDRFCRSLPSAITYSAWVEPGRTTPGNSLWVELTATLNGSVCTALQNETATLPEPVPGWACRTTDQGCHDSGGGFSSGGGMDAEDKANLAGVKTNTGAGGVLEGKLTELLAQGKAQLGGDPGPANCSATFNCTGDPARCAMFAYAREQYCNSRVRDDTAAAAFETMGNQLINAPAGAAHASLVNFGKTVDVSESMNRPRFLADGGCPAPMTVNFLERSFAFDWAPMCSAAPIIQFLLIVGASFVALRLFVGGLT